MRCAKCQSKMVVRQNKTNKQSFWGCKNYPKCTHTEKFEEIELPKEEEFLPAKIRKQPPKAKANKSEHASYNCWKFFSSIGVKDVEIICDTVLNFYTSRGKSIQELKNLDKPYMLTYKCWDDFRKFSKIYLIGINIKYNEPTPTSGTNV